MPVVGHFVSKSGFPDPGSPIRMLIVNRGFVFRGFVFDVFFFFIYSIIKIFDKDIENISNIEIN